MATESSPVGVSNTDTNAESDSKNEQLTNLTTESPIPASGIHQHQVKSKNSRVQQRNTDATIERITVLIEENKRYRNRLKQMENIGAIVAESREQNLILQRDNSELKQNIDYLLKEVKLLQEAKLAESEVKYNRIQHTHDTPKTSCHKSPILSDSEDSTKDNYNTDLEVIESYEKGNFVANLEHKLESDNLNFQGQSTSNKSSLSEQMCLTQQGEGATKPATVQQQSPSLLEASEKRRDRLKTSESTDTNVSIASTEVDLRDVQAAYEFCRTQIRGQSRDNTNTTADFTNDILDTKSTNSQIRQIEEMLGDVSVSSDDEINEGSMTSQFAKLATVFARVAQRVLITQKKAKTSQAFCEALLLENDKLKSRNASLTEETRLKESEILQLKREIEHLNEANVHKSQKQSNLEAVTNEDLYTLSTSATSSDVTHLITKLRNRIKKLERQRAEVLGVNKQWDSQYHKTKEDFNNKITKLKQECADLKAQIIKNDKETDLKRNNIDMLLSESKKQIHILEREKHELGLNYATEHQQNKELKDKVQLQAKEIRNLNAENRRIGQALEVAYGTGKKAMVTESLYDSVHPPTNPPSNCDDLTSVLSTNKETESKQPLNQASSSNQNASNLSVDSETQLQILREQVKVYKEDFETERRDREKSQSEKQQLEEKLSRMAQDVQALNEQVRINEHDFRQERRDKVKLQRQLQHHGNIPVSGTTMSTRRHNELYYDGLVDDFTQGTSAVRAQPASSAGIFNPEYSSRRYRSNNRSTLPPPYSTDTSRNTQTRRIRNGVLEPSTSGFVVTDADIVYPPSTGENTRY